MRDQPALKAALIFVAGILIGHFLTIPIHILFVFSLFLSLLTFGIFLTKKYPFPLEAFAVLSLFSVGVLRYQMVSNLFPPNHILRSLSLSQPVTVHGFLTQDPIRKPGRTELTAETLRVKLGDSTFSTCGKILISVYQENPISLQYGDEIVSSGKLEAPKGLRNPGGFDYRAYLARKNVCAILRTPIPPEITPTGKKHGSVLLRKIVYPARRFAIQTIEKITSGPSRSILQALLVGEKEELVPEIRDDFAKAGVIHVLAVSGLHVGFILLILVTVFGLFRLPYPARVVFTLLGLVFYALLTEARAPVVRATIMASIFLAGTLIERRTEPLNAIGVAALGILFFRPHDLFDIGFQLSFTAVLSIVYFYKRLQSLPSMSKLNQAVASNTIGKTGWSIFLVSLSAQIGTLPLTVYYFNRIPVLSLAANIVVIPLVGLVVALGFASLLFAIVSPWIAAVYGALNQELITILLKFVAWTGSLPISHATIPTPPIVYTACYFILLPFLFNHANPRLRKRLLFLLAMCLNFIVWKSVLSNDAGKLTWIQFDVGQGDSALLQLPRGKTLLIDGGDKRSFFDSGERVIAPYLRKKGIRKLDAVLLTHPHNDHVGGLIYILKHFKIGEMITAGVPFQSDLYHQFETEIQRKKIPWRTITAPDSVVFPPAVKLMFYSPTEERKTKTEDLFHDINNHSLVMRILFGKTRLLFMGDAESEVEHEILRTAQPIYCDAMKVGHHGSATSSTPLFIQQAHPHQGIISVGENNQYHHPSKYVIQRFRILGTEIHRTDQEGAIVFSSDGKTVEKVAWR